MNLFLQNLKIGARSLSRQRAFTVVAITTLALGVGATTAIFSVVYGVLLRPLPYIEPQKLVAFGQTSKSDPQNPVDGSSSHVNFLDWRRASKTIQPMALYSDGRAVISHQGEADVVPVGAVTPDFFAVFRAAPIMGRAFTADEDRPGGPRAVVVSYGFWQQRLGGRADVLSQSVEISGVPWPIVGVAPRGFDFPSGARLWTPVRNDDQQCGRGCVFLNGIGRLADGATADQAQQEMRAIAAALERDFPADNFDTTVLLQTLHDHTVGNVRLALVVLLGAVGMVLLIACANVANLVLVRGAERRTEMAVRTALGAARRNVMAYLLTENLLLGAIGGVLGLVVSWWGIDLLRALAPANVPRLEDVQFDAPTFLFAFAMVLATTVLFGLGPSWQLSRIPLAQAMGQRGAIGLGGRTWARSALLVAEVALSLVLLLGAGLLLRTLAALQQTPLGFRSDGLTVFTLSLPPARYPQPQVVATFDRLDAQFAALPGVTSVARISGLPLGPSENVRSFTRPDQPPPPPGQGPGALFRVVDVDYFATLGIPLLAGRVFTPADREGAQPVVVISKRLAEVFWPGENPVGRPIQLSRQPAGIVVGVVANVRSQALVSEAQPELYVPHAQLGNRTVTYALASSLDAAQVIPAARRVVSQLDVRLPLIGPTSMAELVDAQLARPRFYLVLIGLFAGLALVLAAVGVYGVVAHVVTQRTREIGVRMALGARRTEVVRLMLWQGLRPAIAGVAIGLAVALGAGRVMQGLLYEVRPHDPLTLVGVTAVLIAIVLIACAIPAGRASRVPPAQALRGE
jgi:putative ABC transport system permease protein